MEKLRLGTPESVLQSGRSLGIVQGVERVRSWSAVGVEWERFGDPVLRALLVCYPAVRGFVEDLFDVEVICR